MKPKAQAAQAYTQQAADVLLLESVLSSEQPF